METSVALILGVLGVLGGGGVWTYLQSRKDAPVKKRDADIAAADQSVQMALSVASDLREDVGRLRSELGTERSERIQLSGRVEELSAQLAASNRITEKVRNAFHELSAWADDVIAKWHIIRLEDAPPKKPGVTIDQP